MPNLSVTLEDFDQAFRVLNEMLEKTGQIIEVRADPHTKQILAYDRCYKFLEELKNW